MAKLPEYTSIEDKALAFQNSNNFVIDTVEKFDSWYRHIKYQQIHNRNDSKENEEEYQAYDSYRFIFRGAGDAKFKILSSAQRTWSLNKMDDWAKKSYLEYINDLISSARDIHLLKQVFKFYKLKARQRDFPILSILQHYGAPTPLIDWTYSIDVALYFATELCKPNYTSNRIDDYFSVNYIDRIEQPANDFKNLLELTGGAYPELMTYSHWQKNPEAIVYLTDFESSYNKKRSLGFADQRPLTILFNQRIIPQEGLFVFNPSPNIPLEDFFNNYAHSKMTLSKMFCVNINKEISDYIRRKINLSNIDTGFIYPELQYDAQRINERVLNGLVK